MTAVFAARLIKEPFTGKQIAGAVLALAGVVVLISGASLSFFQKAQANPGDLLIILAVVFCTLSPKLFLIIIYLGFVPATLGFFSWNVGVKKLGAGGAMVFYTTLPLYGALLGFLFLGETVGLPHLTGGALIIGGGLVSVRKKVSRSL